MFCVCSNILLICVILYLVDKLFEKILYIVCLSCIEIPLPCTECCCKFMRENNEQKKKFLYGLNHLKARREDVVDDKTSCSHTASRIYENVEKGLKLNK